MIISIDANEIANILKSGGVIAYPTEGVWGIGCDPSNETAVHKLLALKDRPVEKGMILVAGTADQLQPWAKTLPTNLFHKLTAIYDRPTTWLVEDTGIAPVWIRGKHQCTAIRFSQHEGVQALCKAFGGPIVSTSANPSSKAPAMSLEQVQSYFSTELDAIFDAPLGTATQPSQIKNLVTGETLRQ